MVNRIVEAYRYEGGIRDAPRGHPARVTPEDEDRSIVAAAVANAFIYSRKIREALAVYASDSRVCRRLRSVGLHSAIAAQKQLLSASNKEARLWFTISH
ncbi:hypothetical protein HPB48_018486 [Haemaphysalis longicornis]|uniref:Uncharacterized protein n=1 Tax=Haemaphysalis longicornis TaxID=44386 RepID=A0A9J6FQE2_HAELO|nr:hypothetical protein HPB48_018486 [Haemaphysalis longicornis]